MSAAPVKDPLRKRLGQAIKAARTGKRIRQEAVGDSGNLSRLESGRQWISEERLVEIAAAIDTPVWMLFARADGAVDGKLWELMETYNASDDEGRALIDHSVGVAKKYHSKKREPVHTPLKVVRRNNRR